MGSSFFGHSSSSSISRFYRSASVPVQEVHCCQQSLFHGFPFSSWLLDSLCLPPFPSLCSSSGSPEITHCVRFSLRSLSLALHSPVCEINQTNHCASISQSADECSCCSCSSPCSPSTANVGVDVDVVPFCNSRRGRCSSSSQCPSVPIALLYCLTVTRGPVVAAAVPTYSEALDSKHKQPRT